MCKYILLLTLALSGCVTILQVDITYPTRTVIMTQQRPQPQPQPFGQTPFRQILAMKKFNLVKADGNI